MDYESLYKNTAEDGGTILHQAACDWDVDQTKLLISQGFDVNAKDDLGKTPLHCAAQSIQSQDVSIFELLLSSGADVNAITKYGETVLHKISIIHCSRLSNQLTLFKIVEVFKKYGADFNLTDSSGWTPIDNAIDGTYLTAVKALVIVGGVDVNSKFKKPHRSMNRDSHVSNPNGGSILHASCRLLNLPLIKFLLKNGANINAVNDYNTSVLQDVIDECMINLRYDHFFLERTRIIKYLINWDPDVNIITSDGANVLSSRYDYRSYPLSLWQPIVQHLAQLKVSGKTIHINLLHKIDNERNYKNFYEKCIQELKIAKTITIYSNSSVTFFDLLVSNHNQLIEYANNAELVKRCTKIKVSKFPFYGEKIYLRFSKATIFQVKPETIVKKENDYQVHLSSFNEMK